MGTPSLPPGFRFHPTDSELVGYYLKRKVYGKKFHIDTIAEVDLYKHEPWELPRMSCLQTKDLEWYFFSPSDKKYTNGSRTNRTTQLGFWKATGKDRVVTLGSRNVGLKKTLVYYRGRACKAERTDWVMHEYRLDDAEFARSPGLQEYVLCRIHKKSGLGPKNGDRYGGPVEEECLEELLSPHKVEACSPSIGQAEGGHGLWFDQISTLSPQSRPAICEDNLGEAGPACLDKSLMHVKAEPDYTKDEIALFTGATMECEPVTSLVNAIEDEKLTFSKGALLEMACGSSRDHFVTGNLASAVFVAKELVSSSADPFVLADDEEDVLLQLYNEVLVSSEDISMTGLIKDKDHDGDWEKLNLDPPQDGDFLEWDDLFKTSRLEEEVSPIEWRSPVQDVLESPSSSQQCQPQAKSNELAVEIDDSSMEIGLLQAMQVQPSVVTCVVNSNYQVVTQKMVQSCTSYLEVGAKTDTVFKVEVQSSNAFKMSKLLNTKDKDVFNDGSRVDVCLMSLFGVMLTFLGLLLLVGGAWKLSTCLYGLIFS